MFTLLALLIVIIVGIVYLDLTITILCISGFKIVVPLALIVFALAVILKAIFGKKG